MKRTPIIALHELGQSVWLDNINAGLIESGELQRLISEGSVYGVTSNPTIFKNAIGADESSYPAQISRLASEGRSADEIFDAVSARDIVRTADLLAERFRNGNGRDGFVSLEVKPSLAHDTAGTIEEARRLWKLVDRPNLFVKIPATKEGIPAIETMISEGVSVNVTLLFSRPQYVEVAEAYRRGIERRIRAGKPLDGLHSVASLFVSRLDTAVDKELDARAAKASGEAERRKLLDLRGKAAVANALDVWEEYRERFFGPAFDDLRREGARPQWILWASTGTKNPSYSDTKYVDELASPDSINTMPRETLDAVLDHGRVEGNRVDPAVEPARRTRKEFADLGISLQERCDKLLVEGVASFAKSFDEMMDVIRERSAALAHRR
ncbi:MAG TPA: transaldolase [Candidatus Eisenbacteria bacterium]|nr:transaldolase [Candidatus Eisenbacteria bacterium]